MDSNIETKQVNQSNTGFSKITSKTNQAKQEAAKLIPNLISTKS